ncbi:hypothetical protein BDB01DRAFT_847500 [Pilobolus umbonatus]|nr:hypothetical protein BDB01DRAFT_847500 [Pilobolus umbonatus]
MSPDHQNKLNKENVIVLFPYNKDITKERLSLLATLLSIDKDTLEGLITDIQQKMENAFSVVEFRDTVAGETVHRIKYLVESCETVEEDDYTFEQYKYSELNRGPHNVSSSKPHFHVRRYMPDYLESSIGWNSSITKEDLEITNQKCEEYGPKMHDRWRPYICDRIDKWRHSIPSGSEDSAQEVFQPPIDSHSPGEQFSSSYEFKTASPIDCTDTCSQLTWKDLMQIAEQSTRPKTKHVTKTKSNESVFKKTERLSIYHQANSSLSSSTISESMIDLSSDDLSLNPIDLLKSSSENIIIPCITPHPLI